jgi:Phospholipase D Active site motif
VRFSQRLHAKMVLVDHKHGVVSSSNLTSTAGYVCTSRHSWHTHVVPAYETFTPATAMGVVTFPALRRAESTKVSAQHRANALRSQSALY